MLNILIASQNIKKRNELLHLLPDTYNVIMPSEIDYNHIVEETETSFEGNARLKAQALHHFALSKGLNAAIIADDSGLEVEALKGEPGVHSARYAGVHQNDNDNTQLLLLNLKGITHRKARFVSVIIYQFLQEIHVFRGKVQGTIAYQARGTNGFGYDTVFIPTGFRSTFAELTSDQKNLISHRAQAIKALVNFLKQPTK